MSHKNNSTPIKPLEGSTMTHEDEEWKHDISKLQEQVPQISLSQRETKNEMDILKKGVETKMNGLEAKIDGMEVGMEANMDGMEAKIDGMEAKIDDMEAKIDEKMKESMENMKNDLAKLIQEIFPNGEKIVEETHDENKINVNCC